MAESNCAAVGLSPQLFLSELCLWVQVSLCSTRGMCQCQVCILNPQLICRLMLIAHLEVWLIECPRLALRSASAWQVNTEVRSCLVDPSCLGCFWRITDAISASEVVCLGASFDFSWPLFSAKLISSHRLTFVCLGGESCVSLDGSGGFSGGDADGGCNKGGGRTKKRFCGDRCALIWVIISIFTFSPSLIENPAPCSSWRFHHGSPSKTCRNSFRIRVIGGVDDCTLWRRILW